MRDAGAPPASLDLSAQPQPWMTITPTLSNFFSLPRSCHRIIFTAFTACDMRLINVQIGKIEQFIGSEIPQYAILSHI